MALLLLVLATLLEPCARHALAEAAFFEEISFQAAHLLIQQIVRLMDETDRNVRDDLGRTGFAELLVLRVGHVGISSQMPHKFGFPAVFPPEGELPSSEEIMIVV